MGIIMSKDVSFGGDMAEQLVYVVGEDARQRFAAEYLEKLGYRVIYHESFQEQQMEGVSLLIGPVSFYQGGKLIPKIEAACQKYKVESLHYMAIEEFLLENAKLTAEGFLAYLIENTNFSLAESNILLLGRGRCGQALEKLLGKFSCYVDAYDVIPMELKVDNQYNVVINTIPAQVIGKQHLESLSQDCVLFDIASAPGGYEPEPLKSLDRHMIACLGIPGKLMPQSAGYCIGRCAAARLSAMAGQ
jgi:hypothetical protein